MPEPVPEREPQPAGGPPAELLGAARPTPFVAVLRFAVGDEAAAGAGAVASERDRLAGVLDVLGACEGFRGGWVGRALDPAEDGEHWLLVVHWSSVGQYRRALSSVDVRLAVVPVLALARDEPTGFEVLGSYVVGEGDAAWGPPGVSASARGTG